MKYNTSEYNEKLKIRPVNVKDISVETEDSYEKVKNAAKGIMKLLHDHCTYNGTVDGKPMNVRDLLKKYAEKNNYQIRPKEFGVDYKKSESTDEYYIIVYWVVQGDLEYRSSVEGLCGMFTEIIKMSDASDYFVKFYCGNRNSYVMRKTDPELILTYNPYTGVVDV